MHHDARFLRDGLGTMRYASGEVYKGDWHVGQRSGRGEMIYGTDKTNRYIGSWMNSKKHGPGTFYFGNGDIFVGEWSRGNMHGRGQYIFACGDSFIGFYSNGKKDHGDYYFTQNDTDYRGNWRDELFDGRGSTRYSNNETYLGNWMQGKRHGRDSCYVWPSGSRFNGSGFDRDHLTASGRRATPRVTRRSPRNACSR